MFNNFELPDVQNSSILRVKSSLHRITWTVVVLRFAAGDLSMLIIKLSHKFHFAGWIEDSPIIESAPLEQTFLIWSAILVEFCSSIEAIWEAIVSNCGFIISSNKE